MRPTFDDDFIDSLRYSITFNGGNKNMMKYRFDLTNPRTNRGIARFEFECFASVAPAIKHKIEEALSQKTAVDCANFYAINILDIKIKKVIFNNPATIIIWSDGSKTVVKVQNGEEYDPEKGMSLCCAKKLLGNKSNFNNEFKKWLPKEDQN